MTGTSTFRNANGVSMKMQNFRRVDPEYKGVGLPSGSRLEDEVWEQFASSPEKLTDAVDEIDYEILQADENSESTDIKHNHYWVLVSNPAKWAIDKFLESGVTRERGGSARRTQRNFAAGQLAIVRVGVDRRKASDREGRDPLEPGIYAICEIGGSLILGDGRER